MTIILICLGVIIFSAIAWLVGWSMAMRKNQKISNGYIHIVRQGNDPPYIFLELNDKREIERMSKGSYITLEVFYEERD